MELEALGPFVLVFLVVVGPIVVLGLQVSVLRRQKAASEQLEDWLQEMRREQKQRGRLT
jgi:hypothetical protein